MRGGPASRVDERAYAPCVHAGRVRAQEEAGPIGRARPLARAPERLDVEGLPSLTEPARGELRSRLFDEAQAPRRIAAANGALRPLQREALFVQRARVFRGPLACV